MDGIRLRPRRLAGSVDGRQRSTIVGIRLHDAIAQEDGAMRVVVTGGSGKGGRWVVRDLGEQGHDVLNVDLAHDGSPHGQSIVADLTDLGQCL
jgi:hypothetical protein